MHRIFLIANERKISPGINKANLHQKISDLAGVRLLHIHTTQIEDIINIIEIIFNEQNFTIIEGPVANTWDIEYEKYYTSLKMTIRRRDSLYSSIHYVIETGNNYWCEIQIRTVMDEVWGEVSHSINYPEETKSIACREQIRVLARITSGGTRLVDSIFKSAKEYEQLKSIR